MQREVWCLAGATGIYTMVIKCGETGKEQPGERSKRNTNKGCTKKSMSMGTVDPLLQGAST